MLQQRRELSVFSLSPDLRLGAIGDPLERVSRSLGQLQPTELVIVSDMTGTLISQGQNGFTDLQKDNIERLLNAGATLVLVTADPLSAVKEHFFNNITVHGFNKLFIISNAGQ